MSHGKMKLEQHKSDNAAQVIQVDDSAKECAKSKTAAFLSKNNDSVIRVKYRFGKPEPQTAYTLTTVLDTFSPRGPSVFRA